MRRANPLSIWLILTLALPMALGCGLGKRPYTNDPLLRNRTGVWGNHQSMHAIDFRMPSEPVPPPSPPPTDLPTREWEAVDKD